MIADFLPLVAAAVEAVPATGNPLVDIPRQFGVDGPVLLAQVVNFSIIITVFYFFAIKPLLATVDERNAKIQEGLVNAEKNRKLVAEAETAKTETIRKAQLEAKQIVDTARADAKALYDGQVKEAAARVEEMLKKGREVTELERQQVLAEARAEIAGLVIQTASRVLRRTLTEAEKTTIAEQSAKEITAA